jgi:hypothetical protein
MEIVVTKSYYKGEPILCLSFPYKKELIDIAKGMGAKWSNSMACWHVKNTPANLKQIFQQFKGKAWVNATQVFDNQPKGATKDQSTHGNPEK